MVGRGRARGFEMNLVYFMLALPYVGRKVSQCYCGWLISTATAAMMLLTVSSVPTMVSIGQTDSGLGWHVHDCAYMLMYTTR
jgi:hypothetical protein